MTCRFYNQGRCTRGTECRFRHGTERESPSDRVVQADGRKKAKAEKTQQIDRDQEGGANMPIEVDRKSPASSPPSSPPPSPPSPPDSPSDCARVVRQPPPDPPGKCSIPHCMVEERVVQHWECFHHGIHATCLAKMQMIGKGQKKDRCPQCRAFPMKCFYDAGCFHTTRTNRASSAERRRDNTPWSTGEKGWRHQRSPPRSGDSHPPAPPRQWKTC